MLQSNEEKDSPPIILNIKFKNMKIQTGLLSFVAFEHMW